MNGMKIFGGQIVTLIIVCVISGVVDDFPRMIPVFIPFFVMAALPVLYRAEINRMNEIELATRNSCAQLLLARLIIIGTSDIVCFTFLLIVESVCLGLALGIVNLILYVFVPYVLCVASVLRLMRSGKRSFSSSIAMSVMTSLLWGILALVMPGLYQASAVGIWMICFIAFTIFFVIKHIVQRKPVSRLRIHTILDIPDNLAFLLPQFLKRLCVDYLAFSQPVCPGIGVTSVFSLVLAGLKRITARILSCFSHPFSSLSLSEVRNSLPLLVT